MNIKQGYPLWRVTLPKLPQHTMIIGADVTHGKGKRSLIGFVASMNQDCTQHFSRTQECGRENQEIMGSIGGLVQQAIENYARMNKKFPENIILYRDGVGESQFKEVLEREISSIRETFGIIKKKFNLDQYDPKFMEIIVQKDIHHRFFM